MQKASLTQPATNQHGDLLITTALVETGIHFFVSDGVQRIDELTKTFADREQAKAYYLHVSKAAEQGKRIHQIVWEVQALEEAQNAATGRTPDEVAEAINTDATAYLAAETEVHNRVVQIRDEVLAESCESYAQWRARVRKQVVQANQQGNQGNGYIGARTIRVTPTRVHLKPLTAPQRRLIATAVNGVVRCGPGDSWLLLRGIAERGYGTATYMPGRQIIQSVKLNAAGLAVADTSSGVAA